MSGLFTVTPRADGLVLTGEIYRSDRQEIADVLTPTYVDDASASLGAFQTQTSPGGVGSESLPTNLLGEILRSRYKMADEFGHTYWYAAPNVINVKSPRYGAVGDGTTDDTTALEAAFAAATSGSSIYFPPGTYRTTRHLYIAVSNVTVYGHGPSSIIKPTTMALITGQGVITVGIAANGTTLVPVSNVVITQLTLDANTVCRALYAYNADSCSFTHLIVKNGLSGIVGLYLCDDMLVAYNQVLTAGTADKFGDGIYMGGCVRPKVLFNHVFGFTRIGIVTESESTTKSSDALILGNTIHYGHDSTSTEYNSGIWCENTNGARILGNYVYDMYNSPQAAHNPRGITINDGQTVECLFQITDNHIQGVQTGTSSPFGAGIQIATNADYGNVKVIGNHIEANYVYGIYVASGARIHIENNYFGANDFSVVGGGGIYFDLNGAVVTDIYVGPNTHGAQTHAITTADLQMQNKGTNLASFTLEGLKAWKVIFAQMPPQVYIHNCDLTMNSNTASNIGLGATSQLHMTDTILTNSYGIDVSHYLIRPNNGASYRFDNCTFYSVLMGLGGASGNGMNHFFNNCSFTTSCQLICDGEANVYMRGCLISGWETSGFFRSNNAAGNVSLWVSDTTLSNGADNTAFRKNVGDLYLFKLTNVLFSSNITVIHNFTQSITGYKEHTINDVVLTANLLAAAAAQDGKIIIEDAGAGDRNLVVYAGGQRFRIDGGANV